MADDLPHFRSFVLAQPCQCQPCVMPAQQHHIQHGETFAPWARPRKALGGKRGKGQRASDWYSYALCFSHHGQMHDLRGQFRDFTKETLRAWQDRAVSEMQRRYAMAHPDMIGAPTTIAQRKSKLATRASKSGNGWTVPGVIDLIKKQARISGGEVAAVLNEIANLIERGKVH